MPQTRPSGQRHRKHVGLQRPARAVVGDVANHQPRRHHGKAEVICHWQPGFQLEENVWNNFRQVAFWNTNTFCHRQLGAISQVFIVSSASTLCMSRMFILVLPHKESKLHPSYRTIKSQDNFTQKLKNSSTQKLTNLYIHHLQTQLKIVSLQNKTT